MNRKMLVLIHTSMWRDFTDRYFKVLSLYLSKYTSTGRQRRDLFESSFRSSKQASTTWHINRTSEHQCTTAIWLSIKTVKHADFLATENPPFHNW